MPSIMVVDDDVIIAEELEEILTANGYDVLKPLYSAEEALECAGKLRPDLILMDILFPGGMDGITAARKIKENFGIPVMFFTGHTGVEMVEKVKDLEPVGFVVKPFHEAQVVSNVRLALNQIKIKKELAEAHGRLEKRVRERTKSLAEANVKLKSEVRERKLAQEALAQSETHLRSLMENAESFVVYRLAYDKNAPILLRVVFVSPSITDMMGVSEPMNYENWFKNIHPEDLQRMMDANFKAWETHRFDEKVRIFHPREKSWKWIHAISTGVQIENGRPKFINGLIIDITREKAFEAELRTRDRELEEKATHLEEANTALRVLLRKRDQDKLEFEEKILANVRLLIEPHLESLKNSDLKSAQKECLQLLESSLKEIISPFSQRLSSKYVGLTPGELEVAYLVKEGRRTKDIAAILNLSDKTIEDYRKQLRLKLGIKNKRINLRTHLLSLQ